MLNSERIDILFCGLLRAPNLFKKSISDLIKLKKEGVVDKIIISTWIGEFQKDPDTLDFLKKNKIILIENEEPEETGGTYVMHQMKSLDEGLKHVGENHFVLKTRTDVYINPLFLKKLFTKKKTFLTIKKDLPKGNIFKYKVWVPWYEIKTPFYMADECFFGYADDLKLLFNYNEVYDKKYQISGGPTHIRRFINPFLKDYPIFYDYLEKYSREGVIRPFIRNISRDFFGLFKLNIMKKFNEQRKFAIFRKKLETKGFMDCLAAYYFILYSHFYIDSCSFEDQIIFGHASKPVIELDNENIERNFNPKKSTPKFSGQVYGYDIKLLDNIINKRIKKDFFSGRLLSAIDKFETNLTS
ncbi:MAG: hypothetical protein PHH54_05660 [Candidatus Nanoarchaeia archaeon]|nr:hypothetical protein [Candidatus Nanoarchaeia archaeon]MDD5741445.1 hypothetical protein [Candidatus Nanoarchaeia archaeon]